MGNAVVIDVLSAVIYARRHTHAAVTVCAVLYFRVQSSPLCALARETATHDFRSVHLSLRKCLAVRRLLTVSYFLVVVLLYVHKTVELRIG